MKSRGKKKEEPKQETVPFAEIVYRVQAAHLLMADRAYAHASKQLGIAPRKSKRQLLEQKDDGVFAYGGKHIHFKNSDAIYAKTFRAIFQNQSVGLGYAPYTKIDQAIVTQGASKKEGKEEMVKRIQNMIRDIYRYSDLPKTIPTGEKLIEIVDGKGVILRNPILG